MALGTALSLIASVLRSQFADRVAPQVLDDRIVNIIKPQLDKIQSSIQDLKMKDQKVARDQFEDALMSMKRKFQRFSTASEEILKRHTDEIKSQLVRAQESALKANHSGLKTEDMLESYQWFLATELLSVLNEATPKAMLEPADVEWINERLAVARQKCNKYLQKANEIKEITDYIASQVDVDGYKKGWSLKFKDRSDEVSQLLNLNFNVEGFFSQMKATYGVAAIPPAEEAASDGDGSGTQLELLGAIAAKTDESPPSIMGLSPVEVACKLLADGKRFDENKLLPLFAINMNNQDMRDGWANWLIRHNGSSEEKIRALTKIGFVEVADMENGGTAEASSSHPYDKPKEAFQSAGYWRSQKLASASSQSPCACAEFLQRNLTAPVVPFVFAMTSCHASGDGWYGPAKFKVVARGEKDDEEWDTLLEVDGVEWKNLSPETKFWTLTKRKRVESFRVEISEIDHPGRIWVQRIRLYR